MLKLKNNYYTLRLTLSKTVYNDWNLSVFKLYGVYYRQYMAFVIHIKTNPHTRMVSQYI